MNSHTTEPTAKVSRSDQARHHGLSLTHKLLALIGTTTGAVVVILATYFPSQQIEASQAALQRKATTYGGLIARQVASAIAFEDRETAREVFDSVAQDADVESLVLFKADGTILHSRGVAGEWIEAAKRGVVEQKLVELADRIAVVTPVVALEGPRGTLVLELSTRALEETKASVTRTAVLVGAATMLLGMLLAYAIARSLGRRIASIAETASAVSAGDLAQEPVAVRGRDEIATLATAFNAMLSQIQTLIAQIRDSAAHEKARLETLVRARTQELDRRTSDMRLVLDNVNQGFLTVDLDGQMSSERSAIIDVWLGPPSSGQNLFQYVDTKLPGKGDYLRVAWEALREDWMPLEMRLSQLPSEFEGEALHLGFAYQPIYEDENLSKLLVIVSDLRPLVERRRAEDEERELVQVVRKLLADHTGFKEYLVEAAELVSSITSADTDVRTRLRALHTLKGNSAIFGFESLVRLCHELEGSMQTSDADLGEADKQRLSAAWTRLREKVDALLNSRADDVIEIRRADVANVVANLNAGARVSLITRLIHAWDLEPTEARLQRLAEYGRSLAGRLGKTGLEIRTESHGVRLHPEAWTDFWHALVHVVRNAIDHGIESSDERIAAGKPECGLLVLRSQVEGGQLRIEVQDDGRGVDWTRVADVARKRGLPADTREQLVSALMSDGLSTREQASETSGRGVGLSAVRAGCAATGGAVGVESQPGRGAVFSFSWTIDAMGKPVHSDRANEVAQGSVEASVRAPRMSNVR